MKVGDVIKFPPILAIGDCEVDCMVMHVQGDGVAQGRLSMHGIRLADVTLIVQPSGEWEVTDVKA